MHEEKTARHLDRLSEALDSGTQYQVRHLLNNLSASEIGDLLESLPITRRLAVWEMTDPELEGDVFNAMLSGDDSKAARKYQLLIKAKLDLVTGEHAKITEG